MPESPRFYEGKESFLLGKEKEDCPYEDGTQEYADWMTGWQDGWNLRYDRYNKS